jgi:hypothetical protein
LLPLNILTIISSLYFVVNSKWISEQAREEKWAVGGNRAFVIVAGLSLAALTSMVTYSQVERSLDPDRPPQPEWWSWFFFIVGILAFISGAYFATKARNFAEQVANLKNHRHPFLFPLRSSRCVAFLGIYNLAWGVWWIWAGWPF